jgi:hypothetical protein
MGNFWHIAADGKMSSLKRGNMVLGPIYRPQTTEENCTIFTASHR